MAAITVIPATVFAGQSFTVECTASGSASCYIVEFSVPHDSLLFTVIFVIQVNGNSPICSSSGVMNVAGLTKTCDSPGLCSECGDPSVTTADCSVDSFCTVAGLCLMWGTIIAVDMNGNGMRSACRATASTTRFCA
jgi:hypothetical protein